MSIEVRPDRDHPNENSRSPNGDSTSRLGADQSLRVDQATGTSSASRLAPEPLSPAPSTSPPAESLTSARGSLAMWLKRAVLVTGVIGAVVAAVLILPGSSSDDDGPKLLHTIGRADMRVTVIEQGTLESSDNTEIKCQVRGWSKVIFVVEGGVEVKEGDELVRLDTKQIDDAISLQTTNSHESRATLERSRADLIGAEIAIEAYLDGTFKAQEQSLERELIIAEENLRSAEKMLRLSEMMFKRGYVSELEVEGNSFTVTQAQLELNVKQTEMDVLQRFTKAMQMETLRGRVEASKSKVLADEAGLEMDEIRLNRALTELEQCVIRAPKDGLVIYPSAAAWKNAPDVQEGANVRKDQILLLMPDLSKMQVKVGIHESIIDRVKPGIPAKISLPDETLEGKVISVASVTRPAGWWTGNVVKYDVIIGLPASDGLKPGMSAEVELVLSEHYDEMTIPVAAVIETVDGHVCWVMTSKGPQRRPIQIGDSNDVFIIVESGLKEGDEVVLNPLAYVDEAQNEMLKPTDAEIPSDFGVGASETQNTSSANAEAQ